MARCTLQRVGLDLPEVAVQSRGAHRVVLAARLTEARELGGSPPRVPVLPIDREGPFAADRRELELVAACRELARPRSTGR